jgi:hypothetical protein
MSHPAYLRAKARELRTDRRLTIDEIGARLALPRTTIYYWVRDLPIAFPRGLGPRADGSGTRAMQAKYRRAREVAYEEGRRTFTELAADPGFRDFLCLYLAEGSKRDRNRVGVCNSDPAVIRLCDASLRRLTSRALHHSIQYHADQDLDELRRFWAAEVGVDPESIRLQRKSNSNQLAGRTWRSPYGVLTVSVNDTLLRARLQGWLDCLRESWL